MAAASYPTTVRRKVFDIAAKLVRGKNRMVLKVTSATWTGISFERLWQRACGPPLTAG